MEIILHFYHFNVRILIQQCCQHDSSSWRQSMAPFVSYKKNKKSFQLGGGDGGRVSSERGGSGSGRQQEVRSCRFSFNVFPEAVQIWSQPISLSICISLSRNENWVQAIYSTSAISPRPTQTRARKCNSGIHHIESTRQLQNPSCQFAAGLWMWTVCDVAPVCGWIFCSPPSYYFILKAGRRHTGFLIHLKEVLELAALPRGELSCWIMDAKRGRHFLLFKRDRFSSGHDLIDAPKETR